MSFYCALIIPILWILIGYSLASGEHSFIGNFDNLFLKNVTVTEDSGMTLAIVAFLGMFAAITPALISGAVADRMKFSAWAVFVPVWFVIVYVPLFKWIYGGWLADRGSLDFAGGTAIHVNAGIASLVAAIMLGRRRRWPDQSDPPHSMPLVMIGTGILWFGWFGFNGGSALSVNGQAVQAFLNTFVAAAAGGLAWLLVEWRRDGHPTTLGAASGIVAGLVAITPGAGFVNGVAPIVIGAIAGAVCCYSIRIKFKGRFDDTLDVVGIHGVGGLLGSLCVGLFANPKFFDGEFMPGLFFGGGIRLFAEQLLANGVAIVWGLITTVLILLVIQRLIGLRVTGQGEIDGLDISEHAEEAYHS